MNYSIDQLIQEAAKLPPIPQAAQKALAFIRDPKSDAADLASVLGKDQVLGWSWLIASYKWNFQTKAEDDSELLQFDGAAILARCEQEPKFG